MHFPKVTEKLWHILCFLDNIAYFLSCNFNVHLQNLNCINWYHWQTPHILVPDKSDLTNSCSNSDLDNLSPVLCTWAHVHPMRFIKIIRNEVCNNTAIYTGHFIQPAKGMRFKTSPECVTYVSTTHVWFGWSLALLQPLRWCCVDCVIQHERDVREEQHHTYMWREQAIKEWSWPGSSADISLWTIELND